MPDPKYPVAQSEAEQRWFPIILKGLADVWCDAAMSGHWWIRTAMERVSFNHAQLITSRNGDVVYMLRCWLSPPKPCTNGQHAKYESGDAVLLHWILQPDDIPHLHNHPWSFETRILAGGYIEERCHADEYSMRRDFLVGVGDSRLKGPQAWHRIASHLAGPGDPSTGQGGTWSLVTTGPRVQPWSFLIDGQAVDAEGFLRAKRDQEATQ